VFVFMFSNHYKKIHMFSKPIQIAQNILLTTEIADGLNICFKNMITLIP